MRWKRFALMMLMTIAFAIGAFNTDGRACQVLTNLSLASLAASVLLAARRTKV